MPAKICEFCSYFYPNAVVSIDPNTVEKFHRLAAVCKWMLM